MSVATTEWVQKELGIFQALVDDNTDDFSYAARRDLEWVNEHMDDVLDTRFSLATLLQTPGRLKGAPSPRKARLMARNPQTGPLSPKSINALNNKYHKAVDKEVEFANRGKSDKEAVPQGIVPMTVPVVPPETMPISVPATATPVAIFSDGSPSPDTSFHSAEDPTEHTSNTAEKHNEEGELSPQQESEFTFTSLPPREPLTAKTPASDSNNSSSLRVQRIRQNLEKSAGSKFSSMIIDGEDDFTKSAAIIQNQHSPSKTRDPQSNSPHKIGSLYPSISPSKSSNTTNSSNTGHGHFFSGAIRRAKMLLFQDDKKENESAPPPQSPKRNPANISRLMAPTASSRAKSPVRAAMGAAMAASSPMRSPSKLYPEIRSPTKSRIPDLRQLPASPTRGPARQPSVKSLNSGTSRVPVPKPSEWFAKRQDDKDKREQEQEKERLHQERLQQEKLQQEKLQQEKLQQERLQLEREQQRLLAVAEEQRQQKLAAEKEAQLERERKERAERAQRSRREKLIRDRQERLEKEREEQEREKERERERERLEYEKLQERLQQERIEYERREQERQQKERMEQERLQREQEELLEEARLESIRLEKENQLRQQQQSRKRPSILEDEQTGPQKVHLSNMRKPLSLSTRVSQNHQPRVSTSMMDSPLNKQSTAGGSLMRQSLHRQHQQFKSGHMMTQTKFGKAVEGVMISNETIKFGSSTSGAATAAAAAAAAAASAAASGTVTPLKRVGPARPMHTTPQQFRSQRTGAFSSSMSFQAKLFKQPVSSNNTPATLAAPTSIPDPVTPAASHVPVTQLPEINSDSEDDEGDGVLHDWANSPELRALLLRQQVMDPDRIFGPLPPLQMEEIFGNSNNARVAKFRGRSSSANWSRDQLTQIEIDSYSEQMGYK